MADAIQILVAASSSPGEVFICASVVWHCQTTHLCDVIEEALHQIALAIDPADETEGLFAVGRGGDIGRALTLLGKATDRIGVTGVVSTQRRARLNVTQQLCGASAA